MLVHIIEPYEKAKYLIRKKGEVMIIRQKVFVISMALLMLVVILELVRRRKLKEEYSWMWLFTGVFVLLTASWYKLLVVITEFLGIILPVNTLFFLGLMFVILLSLHYSVRISVMSTQVKELAQKMAILESELDSGR